MPTQPAIFGRGSAFVPGGGGVTSARITCTGDFGGAPGDLTAADPNPFPFDTADWGDAAYMVNLASNALTIPTTGKYLVGTQILGAGSISGSHTMGFEVQNTGADVRRPALYTDIIPAVPGSDGISGTASGPMTLAAGDLLTVSVYTSGQTLVFSGVNCTLWVVFLGM